MPAKPENEYVLLVVNKIGPGMAPADAAAIYGVTIPKATPAGKRRDAAMAKVRRAVEKWLGLTSEGQAAWAAANWKFDWGHVARYVHEDWLRSQGRHAVQARQRPDLDFRRPRRDRTRKRDVRLYRRGRLNDERRRK